MGLLERSFVIMDDRYDAGCGVQEYGGKFSICEAKKGDKKMFLKWVYPQRYDKDTKENYPGDKTFPMSVTFASSKQEAVDTLLRWVELIKGNEGGRAERKSAPAEKNDTIPF